MKMQNHILAARLSLWIVLMCACMFAACSFAGTSKTPLPLDKAFVLSTEIKSANRLVARWHIASGYYLYTKKVQITFTDAAGKPVSANITLPAGEMRDEANRPGYEAWSGDIAVPVVLQTDKQKIMMRVDYQGCSQEGFCYPPVHKKLQLNMGNPSVVNGNASAAVTTTLQALLSDHANVSNILTSLHPALTILLFVALGLLLAFTPCVLPMVPILGAIILGQKHTAGTHKAFLLSLTYVLGMAITYSLAGVAAASLGSSVQVWLQKPWIIILVSLLFVLLALALFGVYDMRVSHRWQNMIVRWSDRHVGGTYVGVFFMGILSTLIVSPCVTAPLFGVLIYIGQTGNVLFGATALFAMAIGMGIPLILIGVSAGKFLPKTGAWMEAIKDAFGIFMLAMAIWMLSRIVSHAVTMMLWGGLLVGAVIFVFMYLPTHVRRRKLSRGLGIAMGVVGVVVMLGGSGVPTAINKWLGVNINEVGMQSFIVVHNEDELKQQLLIARSMHRPVLLDFYAEWCESCKVMEKNVFQSPQVQQSLDDFVLLRADISDLTSGAEALMKNLDVIAPPTVLFYTDAAQIVNSRRIVGEVNSKEFLSFLNSFMEASCNKNVQC